MSVYLPDEGEDVDAYLAAYVGDGLAELRVGDIRAKGFGVIRRMQEGPRHLEVTGSKSSASRRKKLSSIARLIRQPSPPADH